MTPDPVVIVVWDMREEMFSLERKKVEEGDRRPV